MVFEKWTFIRFSYKYHIWERKLYQIYTYAWINSYKRIYLTKWSFSQHAINTEKLECRSTWSSYAAGAQGYSWCIILSIVCNVLILLFRHNSTRWGNVNSFTYISNVDACWKRANSIMIAVGTKFLIWFDASRLHPIISILLYIHCIKHKYEKHELYKHSRWERWTWISKLTFCIEFFAFHSSCKMSFYELDRASISISFNDKYNWF